MPISDLLRQCIRLRKQDQADQAIVLLHGALRRGGFTGEQIDKAGRFIQRELKEDTTAHRVLILGQCTTTWIANALAAHAWGRGMTVSVRDGEYDNVMQELLAAATNNQRVDTVVFLPWHQRLLGGGDRPAPQRVDDEAAFWQQAWSIAQDQLKTRIVQVGYDADASGPLGASIAGSQDGPVGLIRKTNDSLRQALPRGGYFLDLDRAAGRMGRDRFYDPR